LPRAISRIAQTVALKTATPGLFPSAPIRPAQEIIGSIASKASGRAKFVDMTPWLNGPFKSTDIVCGLPVFWWVRIAKIMEFLGGSVVVIQIVGESRVESFARRMRAWRVVMTRMGPVRMVSQKLNSVFQHVEHSLTRSSRETKELPAHFRRWLWRASYVLAAVAALSNFFLQFEWSLLRVVGDLFLSMVVGGAVFIAFWSLVFVVVIAVGIAPWDFRGKPLLDKIFQVCASAISIGFLCLAVFQFSHRSLINVHGSTVKKFLTAPVVILVVSYVLFACYFIGVLFSLLILYGLALATFFVFLPCIWVADKATASLASIMRHTGAVRLILIISLLLLAIGFVVDLGTS
jgi:hypothetical protein